MLIYRPTKWKGRTRRTWEVTIVMETNSLGVGLFPELWRGRTASEWKKDPSMLVKGEGGCFHLTAGGWVRLPKSPRSTHTT